MKKELCGNPIVIVGGGISGLTLAWALRQRHGSRAEITLVEQSSRLGGWIQTVEHEGFIFELGPRSCRPVGSGVATLQLVEALGLQDQVVHAAPAARHRFICTRGQLVALPTGLWSALGSPLTRPILSAAWREWRSPKGISDDESIHDFATRRLGAVVASMVFDPLTVGIYAGDPRQLSMKCCFPQLWNWEKSHGSLICGMLAKSPVVAQSPFVRQARRRGLFTFRLGMEQLVQELAKRLEVKILLGRSVEALGPKSVHLKDGLSLHADLCYLTTPAHRSARLLAASAPRTSACLAEMDSTTVTVVSLGYWRPLLKREGFGYLVPSWDGEPILGVVWDSSVFPQHNKTPEQTRLTVMLSGEPPDALGIACAAVERHLGISAVPAVSLVTVRRQAIPQYPVGHQESLRSLHQAVAEELPGIWLASGYVGVGVSDCIARSIAQADQ